VNGFQGQEYSTSQTVRNDIFRPKVAAVVDTVLKRSVSYSVQGRAGEVCFCEACCKVGGYTSVGGFISF